MIRVVVADDHRIFREALVRLLSDYPDLTVVGEAADADGVLDLIPSLETDVLLLDVSMPGTGFLPLLERLRAEFPGIGVVVLSAHAEEEYAIRALRSGALGYVTKERSTDELIVAVRRASNGERYITESLSQRLAADLTGDRSSPSHERLSNRELDVLRLTASGLSTKEIGHRLGVSAKTVSTNRSRMLAKLGLKSTADLIRYAIQYRLTD